MRSRLDSLIDKAKTLEKHDKGKLMRVQTYVIGMNSLDIQINDGDPSPKKVVQMRSLEGRKGGT